MENRLVFTGFQWETSTWTNSRQTVHLPIGERYWRKAGYSATSQDDMDRLNERIGLLASTDIWAGLGEHLTAIETKLCAPMQWLQSYAGTWSLLGRRFVLRQDASQIQRQQLLRLSHNEDFAFGICFPIECHHASDYLER
jgi:hypothetical protein